MLYRETTQSTYTTQAKCGMLILNLVVHKVTTRLQSIKQHPLDKDCR
jgi:hypothetical protein